MADARPGDAPEERLEHEADALEARIDELGEHIDEAQDKAKARREEAQPLEDAAGDWEEERPAPQGGDDPQGAVEGDPEGSGSPEDPPARDAGTRTDDT